MARFLADAPGHRPTLILTSSETTQHIAAALLWTMSLSRDRSIDTCFRVSGEDLFKQARQLYGNMPRVLTIRIPHREGHANLFVCSDGSAILSYEDQAGSHDILPFTIGLADQFRTVEPAPNSPHAWPSYRVFQDKEAGPYLGLLEHPSHNKGRAVENLTFDQSDRTRTIDSRYQASIDAIFFDMRRAADALLANDNAYVDTAIPGTKLPDGRINRWSASLPYCATTPERIAIFKQRASLALRAVQMLHDDNEPLHIWTRNSFIPQQTNNAFEIGENTYAWTNLTYHLTPYGLTEQDCIGYERGELDGFHYDIKFREDGSGTMTQKPKMLRHLSYKESLPGQLSSHNKIQIMGFLAEARIRKEARLRDEVSRRIAT